MKYRKIIAVAMSVVCLIGILPIFASADEYLYTETYYAPNTNEVLAGGNYKHSYPDVLVRYAGEWESTALYVWDDEAQGHVYMDAGGITTISLNGDLDYFHRYVGNGGEIIFPECTLIFGEDTINGITIFRRSVALESTRRVVTVFIGGVSANVYDVKSYIVIYDDYMCRYERLVGELEIEEETIPFDIVVLSEKQIDDTLLVLFRKEYAHVDEDFYYKFTPILTPKRIAERVTDGYTDIFTAIVDGIERAMEIQVVQTVVYIVFGMAVIIMMVAIIFKVFRR